MCWPRWSVSSAISISRSPVVELNRAVAIAQAGSPELARKAFERALALARSERERRFLERRIAEL